ncbi:hypothetical protein AT4G12580 [Arabidopsis thaliana]|jgi:hypothetical protein|uniref:Uncharacterized protein n=2 Tax=Arabidopsis thaliana TaxID=3702 RepID=A0A5S9XRY7_ARATH|nr:uncharacterized protein AT4G12580 [Arabidopsis thaliana]AEE83151.1 hypothetical protein AT4G12580 [Arabidopsis thaliana]CAA0394945.1 unnamed protein product [Arabidopsis thaliana]|eukprot:NP_001154224.1 hypothetical protein AT4G12580 [Arabidopsis thaliana]
MAGVEVEKIVSNTEEKTTTETPKKTVHADDSATVVEVEIKGEEVPNVENETEKTEIAPVKEEKPVVITAVVEEKDGKPAVKSPTKEEKPVDGKAV